MVRYGSTFGVRTLVSTVQLPPDQRGLQPSDRTTDNTIVAEFFFRWPSRCCSYVTTCPGPAKCEEKRKGVRMETAASFCFSASKSALRVKLA
ncbi:uncharacterized protein C11orf42-like protein [Anopheles sinensis]|uniref:Uncharacterized protein C11orf42-like protein n=1 Tax=Anopheles sinensis TaxID=74873 RepID=A0A084WBL4_ANOSI|nr:uncharacterized protein C11orf42-like protein [Anopheles sinensis]